MEKMHIQLLNDAFEIFWCNELTREEKKKDVRFTFVIQTERINDAIGRIFMTDQEYECINIEVVWLFCMRKNMTS